MIIWGIVDSAAIAKAAQSESILTCLTPAECGVQADANGDQWMYLPQGVFLITTKVTNPLDSRFWSLNTYYIPAEFQPGCYGVGEYPVPFTDRVYNVAGRLPNRFCEALAGLQ